MLKEFLNAEIPMGLVIIIMLFCSVITYVQIRDTPKQIIISDRITACEEKGGKYNYFYNEFTNEYQERCQIINNRIEDF